jgi:hypothetical protein
MRVRKKRYLSRSDAVFIGWLKTRVGDPFPLYNITVKRHPSYGSTVTRQTLRKLNLRIPKTPDLKEEEERIERRQKEGA